MSAPFTISVADERRGEGIGIEYWLVSKAIVIRITDHPNLSSAVYAPNFEKVDGAYCFWSVHAWLHACVTLFVTNETIKARVLKFHMRIPHKNS